MQTDRRAFIASSGSVLLLTGCMGKQSVGRPTPAIPLESLVRQIKHDIGSYIFEHQDDPELPASSNLPCWGQIAFAIQKVKLTVTVTSDHTIGANGGLKVPVDILTIEASGSSSRLVGNSVTTSLTIWPITASKDAEFEEASVAFQRLAAAPPPSPDFEGTPIRDALNNLLADLKKTADTPPCFNFGEGDNQKDNIVKWAFKIEDKRKVGGKLSLLFFSVGADNESVRSFANTIEVNFIATGDGFG